MFNIEVIESNMKCEVRGSTLVFDVILIFEYIAYTSNYHRKLLHNHKRFS